MYSGHLEGIIIEVWAGTLLNQITLFRMGVSLYPTDFGVYIIGGRNVDPGQFQMIPQKIHFT